MEDTTPTRAHVRKQLKRGARPYKRVYKACEHCRNTKSRCERDDDHLKCLKCRRENRECVLPPERSSKRFKGDAGNPEKLSSEIDTSRLDLGARRHPTQHDKQSEEQYSSRRQIAEQSWRYNPDRSGTTPQSTGGRSTKNFDEATVSNVRPAGQREAGAIEKYGAGSGELRDTVVQEVVANPTEAIGLLFRVAEDTQDQTQPHDTALVQFDGLTPALLGLESVSQQILELWSQHRFVRQGWFTEREAIAYVQTFYSSLAPLSPVLENFHNDYTNHRRLVVEEPLLCCAILMISSRHNIITGSGGTMRADFIHSRLWRHIEHLLQRILLGAEKYSVAKSRTLGSIQALLLITDWHPRAVHFPPDNDGWDASLAPSVDDAYTPQPMTNEATRRWRDDVFEPAKRSDRLSWMLIGMATTLAHELGVFKPHEDEHETESHTAGTRERIRKLLYLYTAQLSLRLGCTNIFPQEALLDVTSSPQSRKALESRSDELMLSRWIEITKLLSAAADMFFGSPSTTKKLLRGTRYLTLLNHFKPMLDAWYQDFRLYYADLANQAPQKILLADYYFVRMYVHSIAMQALVEQTSGASEDLTLWPDRDTWRAKHSQEFNSVNEVRECSCKILSIAVDLSEQGLLQHCPVRLYLRVVCASVFLLKALSLGTREADAASSLEILDCTIQALQTNRADDIHLSGRYSILIARHVERFKRNFRLQRTESGVASASRRRRSPVSGDQAPDEPDGNGQEHAVTSEFAQHAGQTMLEGLEFDENADFWMAQPFDPNIAPFGLNYLEPGVGLAADSLDFLWNV